MECFVGCTVFSFCAHRHSVLGQLHSKFMAQNAEWFIRLYYGEIQIQLLGRKATVVLCITCSSRSHLCCETNWVQCNGFGSYLWLSTCIYSLSKWLPEKRCLMGWLEDIQHETYTCLFHLIYWIVFSHCDMGVISCNIIFVYIYI